MDNENTIKHENDKLSKLEMFIRASENLDNNNLILQYRAIRHIGGISRDNEVLLNWMQCNHYNLLENIAGKLQQKMQDNNDIAIANEAKVSLELIEPFMRKSMNGASSELACFNCGKSARPEWKLCPECGGKLGHHSCSGCGEKLEPSWKLCPYCGLEKA